MSEVQQADGGAHDDDEDDAVGEGVAEARGIRLVEDLLGHDPGLRRGQEDDRADGRHRARERVDQPGQEGRPDERQDHPPERRRLVGARARRMPPRWSGRSAGAPPRPTAARPAPSAR